METAMEFTRSTADRKKEGTNFKSGSEQKKWDLP